LKSNIISVFSVTRAFRNLSNMMICCSISLLLPMPKTVVLLNIFLETTSFQDFFMNGKFKGQHLFELEVFCNIINVFTASSK